MKRFNKDPDAREFVRFTLRPIVEHWLVILTFVLLALTGLPQKFFEAGWARWLTALFGGIDRLRMVHRATGFTFTFLAIEHVTVLVVGLMAGRVRPTMVPIRRDFRDAIDYLRYCLGLTEKQPRMDRFDYRQKFEYWGLLMGSTVMILSGLVLYFPSLVTSVLPGVVVPAMKMAHSNEALLALLTVITWHAYGAHFNPEVFPFDKSIFTGKIPRARMLHEHPLEYERMFGRPAPSPHGEPGHGAPPASGGAGGGDSSGTAA